ncbi:MAG TPA: hypothetical protein VFU63_08945 [Ktedonobacterales bacterium]|nr:hypothetical protein [Ktedonobacterales bacterium]
MTARSLRPAPRIGAVLTTAGTLLLVIGCIVGWVLPRVIADMPLLAPGAMTLANSGIDTDGFLGADLTALAVIIAVVIGFNATTLQIASQEHSLAMVRAVLLTLGPFLLCWCATTGVALVYFLEPPVYMAQLWQVLLWFGAVVVLMVSYLWNLPWRLSGEYAALWAIRELRRQPIDCWETLDGFSVLQSGMSSATSRGDFATVRAMAAVLGAFLVGRRDRRAEQVNSYDRSRYRALKNLLTGCSQNAGPAPNAIAYYLGFVLAGVLLQATAVGHPIDDDDHDLYSGLFRELRQAPERLDALWTGMRHGLCRQDRRRQPYLLVYWREHASWPSDDPRRAKRVAEAIVHLFADCQRVLNMSGDVSSAVNESADMMADLYRDLAIHLGPLAIRERSGPGDARIADMPLMLLDTVHAGVMRSWPAGVDERSRVALVNAYEERRTQLIEKAVGTTAVLVG